MKMAKKYNETLVVKNLLDSQQVIGLSILSAKATAPVIFKRLSHFETAIKAEKANLIEIKDPIPAAVKKDLGIKDDERKELEKFAEGSKTVEQVNLEKEEAPPEVSSRRRAKKEKLKEDLKEDDVRANGQKLEADPKDLEKAEPKGEAKSVDEVIKGKDDKGAEAKQVEEDKKDEEADKKPAARSNRRAAKDDKKDEGEK